jgi:hypothetical protein
MGRNVAKGTSHAPTQCNLWKVAISHSNSGADKNSNLKNGGMVEAGHSTVQAGRRKKLYLNSMTVTQNH